MFALCRFCRAEGCGSAFRKRLDYSPARRPALTLLAVVALTVPVRVLASPPGITLQPQARTVVEGTNYTFTVTATGSSPLSYQWRRDSFSLAGKTDSSLSLTSIQTNDAGVYTVVVANHEGSVTSAPARLTVRL